MQSRRLRRDRLASLWLTVAGLGVMALVVVMLGYLISVSWPLLKPPGTTPSSSQVLESRALDTRAADMDEWRIEWLAGNRLQLIQHTDDGLRRSSSLQVPEGLDHRQAHLTQSRQQLWLRMPDRQGDRLWLARLASTTPQGSWQQQWLPGPASLSALEGQLLVTAGPHAFTQWQLNDASAGQVPLARKLGRQEHAAQPITALSVLRGGKSLILGDAGGGLSHYLLPAHASPLIKAGDFDSGLSAPVRTIAAAHHGLGFAALDADGRLGLYLATAERRRQLVDWLSPAQVAAGVELSFQQEDRRLLVRPTSVAGGLGALEQAYAGLEIRDPHQVVGLGAIFGKVWYEGRDAPAWIWQLESTGAHEPRLSLVPIMWGTLKVALVGLLFAVPLGLGCAIHVACFMAPRQRARIKPMLEMMEALPTVVIGFIAALVVAPFVERELMAVLLGLVLIPLGTMVAGFVWTLSPRALRSLMPENMAAFGLLPLLMLLLWLDVTLAHQLEAWWFEGDIRQWLFAHHGIDYAQRNTLVTGMALGLAVMPTLFTLSEDALSSVPRGLAAGSAALGATPWQSLRRVILPAAAVGLFSAMMIGMGRAVGETMIVLMVAGNTPLVDASLFEGVRSLAATLAIELPEAEVGSSHYRLLFLAALALFLFTFVVNTLAEVLRLRFMPPQRGGWG
jgi:phosphate transport system permease protein